MKLTFYLNIRNYESNYNTYRNTLDSFGVCITFEVTVYRGQPSRTFLRLSLKRRFAGCGHGFGRCDGLDGFDGFSGLGGFGGLVF